MKQAALFDLDGVIIDTESTYTEFWAEMGRRYLPEMADFALRIKGQTLDGIFHTYFAGRDEVQQAIVEALNVHQDQMAYPYIDGAMDFVQQLRTRGVKMAVVTSSDTLKMQKLYREHPEFPGMFDRIFTARDVKRSKPAPDCYLAAAEALEVDIKDAVVFEDSLNGLQAGRASGAYVVGLATSYPKEQIAPLCDRVISNFREADFGSFEC